MSATSGQIIRADLPPADAAIAKRAGFPHAPRTNLILLAKSMTITIAGDTLVPIISLAAGIGILLVPRLLNYIVAGYLILIGVLGLVNF